MKGHVLPQHEANQLEDAKCLPQYELNRLEDGDGEGGMSYHRANLIAWRMYEDDDDDDDDGEVA